MIEEMITNLYDDAKKSGSKLYARYAVVMFFIVMPILITQAAWEEFGDDIKEALSDMWKMFKSGELM